VTDYERLELEVWTDGTIKPVEAVREAADHLVNHFFLFTNLDRTSEVGTERPSVTVSPEIYQTPIERLELSPRTLNCLKRAHITKVGEVLEMSGEELVKIRNFGEKSLVELREKLAERGVSTQQNGSQEEPSATSDTEPGPDSTVAISDLSPADIGELMGGDDVPANAEGGNWEGAELLVEEDQDETEEDAEDSLTTDEDDGEESS
jgi:hypothetical protein